jgi:hypothetical protein
MRTIPIAVLAAGATLAALAATGDAAPLVGADLGARLGGAQLGITFMGARGFESHVWRLDQDGSARLVYTRRLSAGDRSSVEQGSDEGKWAIENNQLCVQWRRTFYGARACFAVDDAGRNTLRLIGSELIEAVIMR